MSWWEWARGGQTGQQSGQQLRETGGAKWATQILSKKLKKFFFENKVGKIVDISM